MIDTMSDERLEKIAENYNFSRLGVPCDFVD